MVLKIGEHVCFYHLKSQSVKPEDLKPAKLWCRAETEQRVHKGLPPEPLTWSQEGLEAVIRRSTRPTASCAVWTTTPGLKRDIPRKPAGRRSGICGMPSLYCVKPKAPLRNTPFPSQRTDYFQYLVYGSSSYT